MQSLLRGPCIQLKFYYGRMRKPILLNNYPSRAHALKLTFNVSSTRTPEVNTPVSYNTTLPVLPFLFH